MDDGFIWNCSKEKLIKKYEKKLDAQKEQYEQTIKKMEVMHDSEIRQYKEDSNELRNMMSDYRIQINELEQLLNKYKNEVEKAGMGTREIEVEYEKRINDLENMNYTKDYHIQQKDAKLKQQENAINNLSKTVEDYEKEILKLMKSNKNAE